MDQQDPGLLVVEEHESRERHVLVRHRDEAGLEQPRIGAAPLSDGELLVLATPGAHRVPSLVSALPGLLRERLTGVETLWLGVGGLAADTEAAQRLAGELGVEIVAPDGGIAAMPGAALYAGHGAGGTGWHRFHPDRTVSFEGARIPVPDWESWAPASPVTLDGVVAVPVPCGLLVRPAAADGTTAVDIAFDIAVNQRFPKIIVTVPTVAEVAALLEGFPPHPVMVVPATPEAAKHTWQIELALRLSRDIVFSAGPQLGGTTVVPGGRFQPFPIVLRQSASGGDQQVLAVTQPPPGWERAGQRSYRFTGEDGVPVLADVVPAGLVLRAEDGDPDPDAEAAPFDPAHWTLTLGAAGAPLGLPVLAAAEQLLAALPDEERAAVRVRMAGVPDGEAAHALDHRAADRKSVPPQGVPAFRPPTPGGTGPAPSGSDGALPPRMAPSGPDQAVASAHPMLPTVPAFPDAPARTTPPVSRLSEMDRAGQVAGGADVAGPFPAPSGGALTPAIPGVPAVPVVPVVPAEMLPSAPAAPGASSGTGWAAGVRPMPPAGPVVPVPPVSPPSAMDGAGQVGGARPFRAPPGGALTPAIPGVPAEPVVPVVPAEMLPSVPAAQAPPVAPSAMDGAIPPGQGDFVPVRAGTDWMAANALVPAVPGAFVGPVPGTPPVPGSGPMPPSGPGGGSPPPASPPPPARPAAAAPPSIMTSSGAPVSTVSSGLPTSTVAGAPKPPPPPPPAPPTPPREEFREEPEEATLRTEAVHAEPEAAADAEVAPPASPPAPPVEEPPAPPVDREPGPPSSSPAIRPVEVPARDSTTGEQNRFVAAAGEDFGIALATVNAALATWPSMRAEDSPAGKADYVAVCLYLSRGEGAANLVNGALRTGEGAVLDGHIPCLMSGLRRLPTHRRAVLRQGRVSESLEHRGDPGTVLTEPGFLAASMDLDVTVPGADLDVLIWPASARRTSELMLSRPVGEAVFTAGARFKTLAIRSVPDDEQEEPEDDPDALSAPKVAVLFRELAPGEKLESADLDDRDRAVLAKLDSVLEGRRSAALRLVEDPDTIARLTTSMVLWRDEAAGEGKPVAVAS
ncbi:hypothetical protein [Amycolatopsis samaneae]|uniref:Uncharacterized protein n=1 Tax=Amycolatopsis samaneae TaxID=664691 RepID=A0ABW5GLA3_9PSEU